MKIIEFHSTKCRHCYKCVRNCEVKAIMIRNERAEIIGSHCILCGRCLQVCPQSAKTLASELGAVQDMIASGERVVATLAPSYMGVLKFRTAGQVCAALRRLGFAAVCETGEGAAAVTEEYVRLIREGKMENIITTCCPSVNELIELYHPTLAKFLAPVVSPMIASGMMIKKRMGEDVKVVFIGPCIAKKKEARDPRCAGWVDAVVSFDDIKGWLEEEGVSALDCEDIPFDTADPKINRLYPVTGGILKSVRVSLAEEERGDGTEGEFSGRRETGDGQDALLPVDSYRKFYVHGAKDCIDLCRDMEAGGVKGCFIEMNMCSDGCIKGPLVRDDDVYKYKVKLDMGEVVPREAVPRGLLREMMSGLSFRRSFGGRALEDPLPTEEQIREILGRIGKLSPEDELNCGACGYPTCRDKAVAVFQGKAELDMCIPYIHQQAESLAGTVMAESPNAIIVVDRSMQVMEYSGQSEAYFGVPRGQAMGRPLSEVIGTEDCARVFASGEDIHGLKLSYPRYGLTTLQNIVYMPKQDLVLLTITDITRQEEKAGEEYRSRLHNMELAQNVIREQMITAQKIARLLGETTARTKTTMTALCDSIRAEGDLAEAEKIGGGAPETREPESPATTAGGIPVKGPRKQESGSYRIVETYRKPKEQPEKR
ncbi:[Fe-Fe] hydrogenase large subunit C-terminal domain-containing protein [Lachnoclostridium sp. Marseille-P6806]|uniref:[Fe-Fe] hydrogenase large subunit C-terminal domain-containing protein n=1 Tax=Lachnoclostridium sp. Marseille-P6806 TaxID=2364793 RepID=UPI00102F3761|nr:[Fe-Fe] hydrogenase large subunit C-terminal domain-containing protein [Lachnoclostridium sp. Marseille-P6806]